MRQQVSVIKLQCIGVVKLVQNFTKAITTSANITYVCCYSIAVILHLAVAVITEEINTTHTIWGH